FARRASPPSCAHLAPALLARHDQPPGSRDDLEKLGAGSVDRRRALGFEAALVLLRRERRRGGQRGGGCEKRSNPRRYVLRHCVLLDIGTCLRRLYGGFRRAARRL